jgi:hypothetical protein
VEVRDEEGKRREKRNKRKLEGGGGEGRASNLKPDE